MRINVKCFSTHLALRRGANRRYGVLDRRPLLILVRQSVVLLELETADEQMSLVDVLVLDGQLIDAPHERLERLLVLGHATAGLHDRSAARVMVRTASVEHEAVEAFELAGLVLAGVDGPVAESLLHAEQVDPHVGQREADLDVLAVRVAHVGKVVARHGALDTQLHGPFADVHVAARL